MNDRVALGYRRVAWCLAVAGALLIAVPAFADDFTYSGLNFDTLLGVYTASNRVTGTFTLALPLAPNVTLTSVTPGLVTYSFFDGVATLTNLNSQICFFELGTDSAGQIVQWNIRVADQGPFVAGDPVHSIQTSRLAASSVDEGAIITYAGSACGGAPTDQGFNVNQPGTMALVAPVPTLPPWALALLATASLAMSVWFLRRRSLQNPATAR